MRAATAAYLKRVVSVAEYVRGEILSGHYGANYKLPTELELTEKF